MRRPSVGLALAAAVLTWGAASATSACSPQLSPVFQGFGDTALYTLVPGGDFETAAAGWTLSKAAVVAEPTNGLGIGVDVAALQI